MSGKCPLAALAAAASLVGPSLFGFQFAAAQNSAVPPASESDELAEVTVVARRVEESLEKVPLTVTAISADTLKAQTVTTGTDLQGLVPTLSVGISMFGATQQYSLRGVRGSNNGGGVIEYFNEVPIDSVLVDSQLWDLSSVQAVAGPQGTLFGRNNTGGNVLFVPQRPTKDFEGFVQARYGRFDNSDVTTVLNLPLTDQLQIRLGGEFSYRDKLTTNISGNDLGRQAHKSLRFSLLYTPLDWLTDYMVVAVAYRHDTPVAQVSGISGDPQDSLPSSPKLYGARYYNDLLAQQARGVRSVDVPLESAQNNDLYHVTNILTADLGGLTAKYIAGFQGSWNHQLVSDLSVPLPIIIGQNDDSTATVTQEGQLLGNLFDKRLDWVTGIYYSDMWTNSKAAYLLFAPVGTPMNDLTTQQTGGYAETRSVAGYAQGTYALTDALKLTVGGRYTHDSLHDSALGYAVGHVCNLPLADPITCRQAIANPSHAVTYNFSLDYQITQGLLAYATTRRGYNAGGFNPGFPPGIQDTVNPEKIKDYEVGLKGDGHLGSMPVRVNVSAFRSRYSDIQRSVGIIYPVNGVNTIVTAQLNAATATLYGTQIDLLAQPIRELTIQASYGFLHTKYDSFESFLGDATGNQFAQAPRHTAHLAATYRRPLPSGELVANASYSYISAVHFQDINLGADDVGPGYGLLDLRLGWENILDKHIDVSVYGKNLADKVYTLNASDDTAQFGFISRQYGDPRTYGIEARYSFGGN
jgi:iron complex outermembrane receptor protein